MNPVVRSGLALLMMMVSPSHAEDRIDLEGTSIIGNSELPKVLYIVPWKTARGGTLVGKPVNSLLDEALAPVQRDVFRRQVEYFEMLESKKK